MIKGCMWLVDILQKPEEISELLIPTSADDTPQNLGAKDSDSSQNSSFTQIKPHSVHDQTADSLNHTSLQGTPPPGPSGRQRKSGTIKNGQPGFVTASSLLNPAFRHIPSPGSRHDISSNDSQWSEVDELDLTSALETEEVRNFALFAYTEQNLNSNSKHSDIVKDARKNSNSSAKSRQQIGVNNSTKRTAKQKTKRTATTAPDDWSPIDIDQYDSDDTQDPCNEDENTVSNHNFKKNWTNIKVSASNKMMEASIDDVLRLQTENDVIHREDVCDLTETDDEASQSVLVVRPPRQSDPFKNTSVSDGDLTRLVDLVDYEEQSQSILNAHPPRRSDLFENTSVSDGDLTRLVDMVEAEGVSGVSHNANTSAYRSPTLFEKSSESEKNSTKDQSGYISYDSDTGSASTSPVKRLAGYRRDHVTPKKQKLIFEECLSPARRSLSRLSMSQNDWCFIVGHKLCVLTYIYILYVLLF